MIYFCPLSVLYCQNNLKWSLLVNVVKYMAKLMFANLNYLKLHF